MLRVAYIFNHARIVGGGELSLIELADAVRRHEVEPVAVVPGPGAVSGRLDALGVPVRECPWPSLRGAGLLGFGPAVGRMRALLRECGVGLVHANGARCMLYAGAAARRESLPCIWHVRVLERDPFLDRVRGRLATAVIANSQAAAASVRPCVGPGRPVHVVHNGFDIARMAAAVPLDLGKTFALPPGPVLLAAGRLSPEKGLEDLLEACALLRNRGRRFSCLLLGDATPEHARYGARLRGLADSLGLDNVRFAPWRDDVHGAMRAAAVAVLPSRRESFGRVIVEAWACGLPVVATRSGGPNELVAPERDGLLVPVASPDALADAIERVLADEALAARLAQAGRERAGDFTIEQHAARIAAVYRCVLRGMGTGRVAMG